MTLQDLRNKITAHNVPESMYSIDEGLKPMAYILLKIYEVWEYFYLDERGGRNGYREFKNEEEACDVFWSEILKEIDWPSSTPPLSVGI